MSEQNKIQLFENQPIRTAWNEEQEEWYAALRTFRNGQKAMWATAPQMIWLQGMAMDATAPMTLLLLRQPAR